MAKKKVAATSSPNNRIKDLKNKPQAPQKATPVNIADTSRHDMSTKTGREKKFRATIEGIQEGYFETDLDGYITYCNRAMLDISGYTRDELIGTSFQHLAPPRSARAMRSVFGKVYKTGQNSETIKYDVIHKDGHTFVAEFAASLIKDRDGLPIGFYGVVRDVTEQVKTRQNEKRSQSLVQQSQKMEALGTLAGGLAHGFNNVLMAIQGNLSLIRMGLPKDHPLQKNLRRINESAEKGSRLAREILSFAKIGKFVVMPTNLNNIVKSTSRMFVRSNPNLKIREIYQEDLWQARVDRVQIGQVLLSLYINAAEAMPDGGNLYLQTENVYLDESYTAPYDGIPGRHVKISVTDSGSGLGEKAKQRVFEPFFSAYRPLRYEGLGLASAYGTIKSHNGIINVYSEKGHGSTFSIYLPTAGVDPGEDTVHMELDRGSETLLLVEDDEIAARVGREILERHGYRVMTASDGNEAVEQYECHQEKIHLIILDVILPDITGSQTFVKIRQLNPNALVLLASGYNVNDQISVLLNKGCAGFVQKPFQTQTLLTKVRMALDRKTDPEVLDVTTLIENDAGFR